MAAIAIPLELQHALTNANLADSFNALAPSCQREHIAYVAEAKKTETRARRAEKTISILRRARSA